METQEDSREFFYAIKQKGWQIWYFQNIFVIVTAFLIPIAIFLNVTQIFWQGGEFTGILINISVWLVFILDITAISILSLAALLEIKKWKPNLIAAITGSVWVIFTLAWRVPWIIREPLNNRIGFRYEDSGPFLLDEFNDISFLLFLLICNLLLLTLLVFNDLSLYPSKVDFQNFYRIVNIGTIFGLANFLGLMFIFIYISGIIQNAWISALGVFIKLILTPILGIRTSKKYFLSSTGSIHSPPEKQSLDKRGMSLSWLKSIWTIRQSGSPLPSKKSLRIITFISILCLIIPLSPFYAEKLIPKADIKISIDRYAENAEALQVLEYMESVDPSIITNNSYLTQYMVVNQTLEHYLELIHTGTDRIYRLTWIISLVAFNYTELNVSVLSFDYEDMYYICWWENGSQYVYDTYYQSFDFIQEFSSFSLEVKWVSYGKFDFSGNLNYISAEQILFLNDNFDLVFYGLAFHHAVS
jgi:hypothetical protein